MSNKTSSLKLDPIKSGKSDESEKLGSKLSFINKYKVQLSLAALVLVFLVTLLFITITGKINESFHTDSDLFQAVFLNTPNNQVYFGKIVKQTSTHLELVNVFYPKSSRQIMPDYSLPEVEPKKDNEPAAQTAGENNNQVEEQQRVLGIPNSGLARMQNQSRGATNNGEIKIIKLGGELHRPKDKMIIPLDNILFIHEIAPDSPLAQTIKSNS